MDNNRLKEIRNDLSTLPVLEERLDRMRQQINQAEDTVNQLKMKYEAEKQDVEQLMEESFTVTLLRLVGKYEGKLSKESQEELLAKIEYNKACERVNQLHSERDEISSRIMLLNNERKQYEAELEERKEEIKRNVSSATFTRFNEIEGQIGALARQLVETDEALRAAKRVIATAESALENLDSAESWATYDVWTRGGIFSHIAKYDEIDQAQSSLSLIDSQMKDLHRELSDVNLQDSVSFTAIDSTTRAVDYWFDNIFTDLNVRSIIQDNQEQLSDLCGKVRSIITTLNNNKTEIHNKINYLEQSKEDLLIS